MLERDTKKYESKNPVKNYLINCFKKKILDLVISTGAKKVLDVGCGEGYLLSYLDSRITDWQVEGFDIEAEVVSQAAQKLPSVTLKVKSIYDSGYPTEEFDLVLCNEVLEHLERPTEALSELKRLSHKWVILSVPNEPYFSICSNSKDHCNKWSKNEFVNLVSKYFKVIKVVTSFPWTIALARKAK